MANVTVGTAIGYLTLDASKFTSGFSDAQKIMQTFFDKTQTMSTRMDALGKSMSSIGTSLTASLTVPIIGFGKASLDMAADYESSMARVQALLGIVGKESEVMDVLGEKAREMGAKTIFSATESADAFQYMAQAGWTAGEMMDGIEPIMLLAAGQELELSAATNIVTDSLKAFGLGAEDTATYVDTLTIAANASNTDVLSLGETFKYFAPVAGALGFTVQEVAVAAGLMANQGIKASQAGTTLRSAFTNLVNPTNKMAEGMEAIGLSITNSDGSMRSMNSIIMDMRESFRNLTEAEKAQYAGMIFGKTAMSGMLAIINSSDEDFQQMIDAVYAAEGATQQFHDTFMDTFKGDMELLKSGLEEAKIGIGEALLPVVREVVQWLTDLVEKFNALDESQIQMIVKIGGIVAAIGPMLVIGGKLISGISSIGKVLSLLLGTGGPIALVVAAVAGLYLAWQTNFGGIQEKTQEIIGYIKEIIDIFLAWITRVWEEDLGGLRTAAERVWSSIEFIFTNVIAIITNIFKLFVAVLKGDWETVHATLQDITSRAWAIIQNIFNTAATVLKTLFIALCEALGIDWQTAWTYIQNILDGAFRVIKTLFDAGKSVLSNIWNLLVAVLKGDWDSAWVYIQNIGRTALDTLESIITNAGPALYAAGEAIINALWNGIKSIWTSLNNWVSEHMDQIVSALNPATWFGGGPTIDPNGPLANGGASTPSNHRAGLDYVPYDNYAAMLHQGERVLTAQENRDYEKYYNNQNQGNTYVFQSPKALNVIEAKRMFDSQQRKQALGFNMT